MNTRALRWGTLRAGRLLSCIPPVVMQKASQMANWTENTDNLDYAEIVQATYILRFASEMREMWERGIHIAI